MSQISRAPILSRKRSDKTHSEPIKGKVLDQPYFYFTGWSNVFLPPDKPPYTRVLAKCMVGPWKLVRAYIECHYGYHNNVYYSFKEGYTFEQKHFGRSFRAYIIGYRWADFIRAKGDVSCIEPIPENENIPAKTCIVVTSKTLPRWGARYLPRSMFDYACDQLGGPKTKRCQRWKDDYWPKGWKEALKRRHFTSLSKEQKEAMEDAFLETDEALFDATCPPPLEVDALLHNRALEDLPEEEKNVGIPKSLIEKQKEAAEKKLQTRAEAILNEARKNLEAYKAERKRKKEVPTSNPFLDLFKSTSEDDE